MTDDERERLREVIARLAWRSCRAAYAEKVGSHEYVARPRTIGEDDWAVLTSAIRSHGVREKYLRTEYVGWYLKLDGYRYWAFFFVLNRCPIEDGTHEAAPLKRPRVRLEATR